MTLKLSIDALQDDPYAFLFYIGALTRTGKVDELQVPNAVTRRNYVARFVGSYGGKVGTAAAFLHDPTVDSLEDLLRNLIILAPPSFDNTEPDLQCLLMAGFIYGSSHESGAERHPPGTRLAMDLVAHTEKHTIILELKTVPGRSLKEGTITWPKEADPSAEHRGMQELANKNTAEIKAFGCNHAGGNTVEQVHQKAEEQVRGYRNKFNEDAKSIRAFAVTQVINRFLVSLVE